MDTDKAIFMKILIVEDEPSLRELMQKTLAKERYVVETAGTFHEASLKIADYSYDCILLDIMLPDGNGLKLLEMLKEQQKRESVIIISARDSIEDKVLGLEQGADDYLPKPFHLAELNARIKSVLRRQRSDGSRSLRLGNRIALAGGPARGGGGTRAGVAEKGVRHPALLHAAPEPSGRQGRVGRSRLGRPYRSGGQFPFRLCTSQESAPAAKEGRRDN